MFSVPLTDLYISHTLPNGTEERVADGSTVTLEPAVLTGVTCNGIIDGGHQNPILAVYVGDEDETSNFEQLAFDQVIAMNGSDNTYHMIQWEKLMYQNPTPTREYHGKTLECAGYTAGYESDIISRTVNLIVKCKSFLNDEWENHPMPDNFTEEIGCNGISAIVRLSSDCVVEK